MGETMGFPLLHVKVGLTQNAHRQLSQLFAASVSGMKMHIFRNQLRRDLPLSSASKDGLHQPPPCILNVAFYLPKPGCLGSLVP